MTTKNTLPPAAPAAVDGNAHHTVIVLDLSDCGLDRRAYATARFSVAAGAPASATATATAAGAPAPAPRPAA